MTNQILTFISIISLIIGGNVIVGCGNSDIQSTQSHEHIENIDQAEYQCPMNCEEGKVYKSEGFCPVCGMDLKKKES